MMGFGLEDRLTAEELALLNAFAGFVTGACDAQPDRVKKAIRDFEDEFNRNAFDERLRLGIVAAEYRSK